MAQDLTPRVTTKVEKSWGCEIWWAETDLYLGKTLIINPNCSTSLHKHDLKDETMLVVRGTLKITSKNWDNKRLILYYEAGRHIRIRPGKPHKLSAGIEGVTLIEVSTPYPKDSIRIQE